MDFRLTAAVLLSVFWACTPEPVQQDPQAVLASCEADDGAACFTYALWSEAGFFGVERDSARSAELYGQACDLGELRGCVTLADLLASAEGVAADVPRAVGLLEQACDAGEPSGCFRLGQMYAYGEGVAKDSAAAFDFFRQSCEQADVGCAEISTNRPPLDRNAFLYPYTDEPFIVNRNVVREAGARESAAMSRAGLSGSTSLFLYVNSRGEVEEIQVDETSGSEEVDRAAERVASTFELEPARIGFYEISVWVKFTVAFPVTRLPVAEEVLRLSR